MTKCSWILKASTTLTITSTMLRFPTTSPLMLACLAGSLLVTFAARCTRTIAYWRTRMMLPLKAFSPIWLTIENWPLPSIGGVMLKLTSNPWRTLQSRRWIWALNLALEPPKTYPSTIAWLASARRRPFQERTSGTAPSARSTCQLSRRLSCIRLLSS